MTHVCMRVRNLLKNFNLDQSCKTDLTNLTTVASSRMMKILIFRSKCCVLRWRKFEERLGSLSSLIWKQHARDSVSLRFSNRQSERHFQSFCKTIYQIFEEMIFSSELCIMWCCTSRLLEKVTLSATSKDFKAYSQLLFEIYEPDHHLRDCTKKPFSCVQIAP